MAKKNETIEGVSINRRLYVLKTALVVEKLTTIFLATLLDAKDKIKGKSFSGGSALSFSHKINLLIDINALGQDDRTLFQKFMEVRNCFMHDLDANTFEKCADKISGLREYLFKRYSLNKSTNSEAELEAGVTLLCNDVYEKTLWVAKVTIDRGTEKAIEKSSVKMLNALKDSIEEFIPVITAWAQRVEAGSEPFVPNIVGTAFAAAIFGKAKEKIDLFLAEGDLAKSDGENINVEPDVE